MSDWGEDEYTENEGQPSAVTDTSSSPGRVFGLDIGGLAGEYVDAEVKASVRKQVNDVATAAVDEALTEELLESLRQRAGQAAVAAVTEQVEANQAADEGQDDDGEEEPEETLYYGSVDEFVREYLRNVYRRAINGRSRVWAARWWEYDEAVIRLEALWRSWEHLRMDPSTGMSVWWRDHADHHMAVLLDPDGPFSSAADADENKSKKGQPLPYAAPPEGLFPDQRQVHQPKDDVSREEEPEPPAEEWPG